MSQRWFRFALTAGLCALLGGCPGIVPGSQPYQPASDLEETHMKAADYTIFPDDIRKNPASYKDKEIAWVGIVKDAKINKLPTGYQIIFTLEHRYFDWIEDDSIQRARFFVSPRGEGAFMTYWDMPLTADYAMLQQTTAPGSLLVVYGHPAKNAVIDGVVYINPDYVRPYERSWYADDVMDYGRPGSPVKILRVPMH